MHMTFHSQNKQRGVSLIEVLIALLVISVGVLGLSKMQALAIANSQVSGLRGMVALEATSLASLMHSDKAYWQVAAGTTPNCPGSNVCVLTGSSTTALGTVPTSCLNTNRCNVTSQMAAWDVNHWMAQMNNVVPGYTATINCSGGTTSLPVVCSIEIVWLEKQAGGGVTTASLAAATPSVSQAYYLYVQP